MYIKFWDVCISTVACSIFIVVGVDVADNIKWFSVAKKTQQCVPFALWS